MPGASEAPIPQSSAGLTSTQEVPKQPFVEEVSNAVPSPLAPVESVAPAEVAEVAKVATKAAEVTEVEEESLAPKQAARPAEIPSENVATDRGRASERAEVVAPVPENKASDAELAVEGPYEAAETSAAPTQDAAIGEMPPEKAAEADTEAARNEVVEVEEGEDMRADGGHPNAVPEDAPQPSEGAPGEDVASTVEAEMSEGARQAKALLEAFLVTCAEASFQEKLHALHEKGGEDADFGPAVAKLLAKSWKEPMRTFGFGLQGGKGLSQALSAIKAHTNERSVRDAARTVETPVEIAFGLCCPPEPGQDPKEAEELEAAQVAQAREEASASLSVEHVAEGAIEAPPTMGEEERQEGPAAVPE
eukprot:CAMPEP_0180693658 /NCGR_PEP_ID=MMETSP1038_2-20121128/1481_1 /TAXON_ID=632150 /ORGANISM="Azadinium spinosum, Strain 3D9" /LENGTH=362 /DNA_ID=CAMNT_0022724921 /DNA_START=18 /DNA_END=1102 /DNA_ORIENTATION=-